MAIIKFINRNENRHGKKVEYKTLGSVKRLIDYILREDKTNDLLKGGIYCNPDTAYDEFILTKSIHGKLPDGPISKSEEAIHFTQSFKVEELTPELAKKIADELLTHELFKGFQVVYAVHTDQKHIHTHFVINSVNHDDGKRWHISKNDLQAIKDKSNELCREYNLSVLPKMERNRLKGQNTRKENIDRLHEPITQGEYRARRERRSWKVETLYTGMAAREIAKSKEEFIEIMNSFGYSVRWEDSRKDITYTNSDGKKINSDKLGFPDKNFTPLTKEELEKQFALNKQMIRNKNSTVILSQEQLSHQILKLAKTLSYNENPYPFQSGMNTGSSDQGQELRDRIKELQKGSGIHWNKEREG